MATRKAPASTEKKPSTRTRKAPVAAKTANPATEVAFAEAHTPEQHTPSHHEVAQLAEQFWIERGRPFGSPEIDWLRAESTLRA